MTAKTRTNAKTLPEPIDPTAPANSATTPTGKLEFIPIAPLVASPVVEEVTKDSKAAKAREAKEAKALVKEKAKTQKALKSAAKGKGRELAPTDTLQSIPGPDLLPLNSPMDDSHPSLVDFAFPIILPAPSDPYGVTTGLGLTSVVDSSTNLEHHARSAHNDIRLGEYILNLMQAVRDIQDFNPALAGRVENIENSTITDITGRLQSLEDDHESETTSADSVETLRRELAGLAESMAQLRNQCMSDRATTDNTIGTLRGQIDNLANTITGDRVRASASSQQLPPTPTPAAPNNPPFAQGPSSLPIRNSNQHANTFHPYAHANGPGSPLAGTAVIYGPHAGLILDSVQDPTFRVRGFVNDLRITGTRSNQVVTAHRIPNMPDTLRIVFATHMSASAFVTRVLASRPVPTANAVLE